MLSLAQPNLAPTFRALERSRRLVVIESGDAGLLLSRIATNRRNVVQVVRVLDVSNDNKMLENLPALLEPQALKRDKIWAIVVSAGAVARLPANLLLQCRLWRSRA